MFPPFSDKFRVGGDSGKRGIYGNSNDGLVSRFARPTIQLNSQLVASAHVQQFGIDLQQVHSYLWFLRQKNTSDTALSSDRGWIVGKLEATR